MTNRIDCVNIHKVGCEYYIDRFFCPENCEGFVSKDEIENKEIIEPEIIEKKRRF